MEEQEVMVVIERWFMTEIDDGAERKKTDIFGPRWPDWWRGNEYG